MIILIILQLTHALIKDDPVTYRFHLSLDISLNQAISARLVPNDEKCRIIMPSIHHNITQFPQIEDNLINTDYLQETEFYFHQFIAAVRYSETEFYVLSDSLNLYRYNLNSLTSKRITNLRDQIAENEDVQFIKDNKNNVFIQSQDQIHQIKSNEIVTYSLVPRGERYQTIFHSYSYIITCVGSDGIDVYQITYQDNAINIKIHFLTQSLHLNAIGISYSYEDPSTIHILDQKLGLVIAKFSEEGILSLDSQQPIQIDNPSMIATTNQFIYVASKSWLHKFHIRSYQQLSKEKINNIQNLITSEDGLEMVVLCFNRHYISHFEWKFMGLHNVIINNQTFIAVTGTNVYKGSFVKLPYRIFCSNLNTDQILQYTLYYNTSFNQHVQNIQIQQIEIQEDNQLLKIAFSVIFILIIVVLFVCLYVQKLNALHQQHERVKRKLENQTHTRMTMNSQMF